MEINTLEEAVAAGIAASNFFRTVSGDIQRMLQTAPHMVQLTDCEWRPMSEAPTDPAFGPFWVSDGKSRSWTIWAHKEGYEGATACKYWLRGFRWPAPPTAEHMAMLAAEG